jgi:hypothetical protein
MSISGRAATVRASIHDQAMAVIHQHMVQIAEFGFTDRAARAAKQLAPAESDRSWAPSSRQCSDGLLLPPSVPLSWRRASFPPPLVVFDECIDVAMCFESAANPGAAALAEAEYHPDADALDNGAMEGPTDFRERTEVLQIGGARRAGKHKVAGRYPVRLVGEATQQMQFPGLHPIGTGRIALPTVVAVGGPVIGLAVKDRLYMSFNRFRRVRPRAAARIQAKDI